MWQSVFASCLDDLCCGPVACKVAMHLIMCWLDNCWVPSLEELLQHKPVGQSSTTRHISMAADNALAHRSCVSCHLRKTSASQDMNCTFGWCSRDTHKVSWEGCLEFEARSFRCKALQLNPGCALCVAYRLSKISYLALTWKAKRMESSASPWSCQTSSLGLEDVVLAVIQK